MIEVCKWKNGADSPVLLMVDDLANVWVDTNGNDRIDPGEDWGHAQTESTSSFRFLNEQLLQIFPEIKTTFFTPVGKRAGLLDHSPINRFAEPINANAEIMNFFRTIHNQPQFEIAYHGTTHGKSGNESSQFIQEWDLFRSVAEAEIAINEGKTIYREVFGEAPKGGKYCGYVSNQFSDASINETGFTWWCRYWNRGMMDKHDCKIGGGDSNPLTAFDIKFFGSRNVIDIPSTLSGALFTELLSLRCDSFKNGIKRLLFPALKAQKYREIDFLLKNQLIIAIQEHIAPSRDDGRRQQPNVFDDLASLKRIFSYLKTKNVWYCTGSELAEYIQLKQQTHIEEISPNSFLIDVSDSKMMMGQELYLKITGVCGQSIYSPDGNKIAIKNNISKIPLKVGRYQIK